jgi:hypothetical protein
MYLFGRQEGAEKVRDIGSKAEKHGKFLKIEYLS